MQIHYDYSFGFSWDRNALTAVYLMPEKANVTQQA